MNLIKIIDFSAIFLIGFLSASFAGLYYISGYEIPYVSFIDNFKVNHTNPPSDYLDENEIEIYEDKVVIYVNGASLSRYAPTGSMIPLLDENSNGIKIVPQSEDEIKIGDIITFEKDGILIIHRVIDKGIDDGGIYFITKGDNNLISDGKIRFKEVRFKTIGILW